jgi:hypothetical protein
MVEDLSTPAEFFAGSPDGRAAFAAVSTVPSGLPDVTVRIAKSQIAFRAKRGFAYVWRPGRRYVRSDVPAVLSLALPEQFDEGQEVQRGSTGVTWALVRVDVRTGPRSAGSATKRATPG